MWWRNDETQATTQKPPPPFPMSDSTGKSCCPASEGAKRVESTIEKKSILVEFGVRLGGLRVRSVL